MRIFCLIATVALVACGGKSALMLHDDGEPVAVGGAAGKPGTVKGTGGSAGSGGTSMTTSFDGGGGGANSGGSGGLGATGGVHGTGGFFSGGGGIAISGGGGIASGGGFIYSGGGGGGGFFSGGGGITISGGGGFIYTGGGGGGGSPMGGTVFFKNGKAMGAMNGVGWVAIGTLDTVTDPTCRDPGSPMVRQITGRDPCPDCGGTMKWSTNDGLCMSGLVPKVAPGDGGTPDYDANWGMLVGWDAGPDDACIGNKVSTLGRNFEVITFNYTGTIMPNTSAIRGLVHRKGDPEAISYCANIISGTPTALISFNTQCWGGPYGVLLTDADIPNIDWVGVEISSDTDSTYLVKNFCVTSVAFR
jgi:hypothetical protein